MTYCIAASVNDGLVFASDSRTNAGIDQVSQYPKTYKWVWEGERVIVLLAAGNLATTQAVVQQINDDLEQAEANVGSAGNDGAIENIQALPSIVKIADYLGRISASCAASLADVAHGVDMQASFILGGQIANQEPELQLIYPQGNHIASSPQQPFLQIGEVKYGKPILDRIITPDCSLEDAARCALVSLDSTMRSNASVGMPIDLTIYRRDSLLLTTTLHFEGQERLISDLQQAWSDGLVQIFRQLPRFDWEATQQIASVSTFPQEQQCMQQ